MNLHDLVTAAAGDSDLDRTIRALVRVAVCAQALNNDCRACEPGRLGQPCDCPTDSLEAALGGLEAVAGPIPAPAEAAP